MREEGESIFLTVCEKVKENRNGWLVRADTIPRRRGRSLETWRNNVSLEERLTRSRWTEHRGSQSFRDRFLIHLPRSFINILQLGWILCTCVSELSLSPHPTWTNEPAEFRALRPLWKASSFPPPPTTKSTNTRDVEPSEIHYSTCSIAAYAFMRHQFYPSFPLPPPCFSNERLHPPPPPVGWIDS